MNSIMNCNRVMKVLALLVLPIALLEPAVRAENEISSGELRILGYEGDNTPMNQPVVCPLKHTDVTADVVGFISRTTVRQVFYNPLDKKIEAVYVFPLPQDAAVDDMTMIVGDRRVVGLIKEREEAREIYEEAKAAGHVAGLLDQERPNIFTQSVANIEPGVQVEIEISFVETLKYEDGVFEWVFPMVVGPRYIPGGGCAPAPMTTGTPTTQVPDADKITPPVTPKGTRSGHDISVKVSIDVGAGRRIHDVLSPLHEIAGRRITPALGDPEPNEIITVDELRSLPGDGSWVWVRSDSNQWGMHRAVGWFGFPIEGGPGMNVRAVAMRYTVPFRQGEVITGGRWFGDYLEAHEFILPENSQSWTSKPTYSLEPHYPPNRELITLVNQAEIPNKDFILRFEAGEPDEIGDAFLTHHDERGDFFTLILQPPRKIVPEQVVPRELIFVMDTSGSMHGFPIDKSKEVMNRLIETMLPGDTFNVITFAGHTSILWDRPRPNTPENRQAAQALVDQQQGGGGTEMMKAIEAALVKQSYAEDPYSVRIVCFLTDGYVGNDMAIIDAVKKNAGTTRVFSFGVGNSVNRYLLDGMAAAGRGEVEYVTLENQGAAAAERFAERLQAPVLTDIDIDWGTLPVDDVYPRRIPDLFSAKPILVHGRLTGPAAGTITLRGNTGAGAYEEHIEVSLPGAPPDHNAIPSLWARAKVADLMNQDLAALQNGNFPAELKQQIIDLGLAYRLLTQFTSFVAVEEMTVTVGGEPTKINVPVEMPEGVSYEGVFDKANSVAYGMAKSPARLGTRTRTAMRGGGTAGRRIAPSSPQPSPQAAPAESVQALEALGYAGDDDEMRDESAAKLPASKLSAALVGLAEKVDKEGQNGNLVIGELKIMDYKVDVMIFLSDLSDATLKTLTDLGFVQSGESKAVKMLTGTIDVHKLEDLVKLDAVIRAKAIKE